MTPYLVSVPWNELLISPLNPVQGPTPSNMELTQGQNHIATVVEDRNIDFKWGWWWDSFCPARNGDASLVASMPAAGDVLATHEP